MVQVRQRPVPRGCTQSKPTAILGGLITQEHIIPPVIHKYKIRRSICHDCFQSQSWTKVLGVEAHHAWPSAQVGARSRGRNTEWGPGRPLWSPRAKQAEMGCRGSWSSWDRGQERESAQAGKWGLKSTLKCPAGTGPRVGPHTFRAKPHEVLEVAVAELKAVS